MALPNPVSPKEASHFSADLRPPTSALAAFGLRKPALGFPCTKQAAVDVAAVGIPSKHARKSRRHRTAHQRQARCLAQQIAPSRSPHCRRTAGEARRNLDRAEIAAAVRPLKIGNLPKVVRGRRARIPIKQSFQYFDRDSAPVTCPVSGYQSYGSRDCWPEAGVDDTAMAASKRPIASCGRLDMQRTENRPEAGVL
jgi:hypothetical protein